MYTSKLRLGFTTIRISTAFCSSIVTTLYSLLRPARGRGILLLEIVGFFRGCLKQFPEVKYAQCIGYADCRPHAGLPNSVFVSLIRYGVNVCGVSDLRLCLS